ncbi:MAG: hypothetical protein QMD53_02935 [Actinomycetota bacterium]|nr:hypothetical protein [Actinomycetota bacterium]
MAIEVKNATTIHPQDIRALKTFGEDYPEAKRFLVYRGEDKMLKGGIEIMPADKFLLGLSTPEG